MLKYSFIIGIFATILGTGAYANEFRCSAQGLDAYLVFDDGPGGLDHFEITYSGVTYTESNSDNQANMIEAQDSSTPDNQYSYDNSNLALQIKAKNGTAFVMKASSEAGSTSLQGQVQIQTQGKPASLPLSCNSL